MKDEVEKLKEKLAAIEHERWADWQKYCHHVLRNNLGLNGPNLELEKVLLRWDKQIATPYEDLSEQEKQSDRNQVDRYWPLIQKAQVEAVRAELAALRVGHTLVDSETGEPVTDLDDRIDRLANLIKEDGETK